MTLAVQVPTLLLLFFVLGAFAGGYGFGNRLEKFLLDAHAEEMDAMNLLIDELYIGLDDTLKALTADIDGAQAEKAVENAEYLLSVIRPPVGREEQ